MAGLNKNYVLGKGRVYFEPWINGAPANIGEIYLSQSTEFNFGVKTETLDHFDADEGLNVLDEQVTTKVTVDGKITTQDISGEQLGLFLLSAGVTTQAQTSGVGIIDTFSTKRGRSYQLGKSNANPSGVRNVTNVVVKKGTTVIAPTEYIADLPLARVTINPATAALADGDAFTVTFDVSAATRETVVSKDAQIRGSLRFIASNPVGTNRDFFFPLVNMSPEGDFALKGDSFQQLGFKFAALKNGAQERIYIDGRPA